MSDNLTKLIATLRSVAQDGKLAIAYSGGVDSTILKEVAILAGLDVLLLTFDLDRALELPEVRCNDKRRCYYCKSLMMRSLKEEASSQGFDVLCDGTNADDLNEYRPGLLALEENGVISPIALSGLSKDELRSIGRELSLKAADKPSSPCLLTRFPYDTPVSKEMLDAVGKAEELVRANGTDNCRVRIFGSLARVELPKELLDKFDFNPNLREKLLLILSPIGVNNIEIDPKGLRSGTMDEQGEKNG